MEQLSTNNKASTYLAAKSNVLSRAWSWVKNSGSWLVVQSDVASDKWVTHTAKVKTAEALASLLLDEGRASVQLKAELLKQIPDADPMKAVQLRLVLREVDAQIRTISVLQAAGKQLESLPAPTEASADSAADLSEHWLDKFFEFTRIRNEDWRADLFAKALAHETASPGSVSLQVLWKLGTLSADQFHALAHLLDVATGIDGDPMIVSPTDKFYLEKVPHCLLGPHRNYGHLIVLLAEAELVYMPQAFNAGPSREIPEGRSFVVSYANQKSMVVTTKPIMVGGVMFTTTGEALGILYEAKVLTRGVELFNDAVNKFRKDGCTVEDLP